MTPWATTLSTAFLAMSAAGEPLAADVTTQRADYVGSVVAVVTDDPGDAAALETLIDREGGLDERVQRCEIEKPTGRGMMQLHPDFWSRPVACGPIKGQVRAGFQVLLATGWWDDHRRGMQFYLGAKSPWHPEVDARLRLWRRTRGFIECSCSR